MKRLRPTGENNVPQIIIAHCKTGKLYNYQLKVFGDPASVAFPNDNQDSVFYGIYFRPPIENVEKSGLGLFILLPRATGKEENELVFSTLIYPGPPPSHRNKMHILDRTFYLYETHQLIFSRSLSDQGDEKVSNPCHGMFIHLTNTYTNVVEVNPDMGMVWFPKIFTAERYRGTDFFPHDVDPAVYPQVPVNMRRVTQRTPLWFFKRQTGSKRSGTNAYKLLGYMIPTLDEDPGWTWAGGATKPRSASDKYRMGFGSVAEDPALILYMHMKPHCKVKMVGMCEDEENRASPDGLVLDPSMSIKEIQKYGGGDNCPCPVERACKGVIEIKSSQTSCNLLAYHLPQVYMEMMASKRWWTDLVRFHKESSYDCVTKQSSETYKLRVFRIYRHKPVEDRLQQLWHYAEARKDSLRQVIQEPPFVQMRAFLADLAASIPGEEYVPGPEVLSYIQDYERYAAELKRPKLPVPAKLLDNVKKQKTSEHAVRDLLKQLRDTVGALEKHLDHL